MGAGPEPRALGPFGDADPRRDDQPQSDRPEGAAADHDRTHSEAGGGDRPPVAEPPLDARSRSARRQVGDRDCFPRAARSHRLVPRFVTVVAGGRGPPQTLFPRDEEKSVWERPSRRLAMVNVRGISNRRPQCPYPAVTFNIMPFLGEWFCLAWQHRSGQKGGSLMFEAVHGSEIDVFVDV